MPILDMENNTIHQGIVKHSSSSLVTTPPPPPPPQQQQQQQQQYHFPHLHHNGNGIQNHQQQNNVRSTMMMMNMSTPQIYADLQIRTHLREIAQQQQQQQQQQRMHPVEQPIKQTVQKQRKIQSPTDSSSPFMLLIGAARAIEEMQIDIRNQNADYSQDQKLSLHRAMSQSSISSSQWYGSGASSASTSPRPLSMNFSMTVSSPSSAEQDSSNEDDASSVDGNGGVDNDEDFLLGGVTHAARSGSKKRSMSEGGVRKPREPHVEAKKEEWRRMSPIEKQSHIRLALAAANDGSQSARQIAISMGIPYTVLQRVRNGKVPLNRVGTQGPRPTDEQDSPTQPKRRKSL